MNHSKNASKSNEKRWQVNLELCVVYPIMGFSQVVVVVVFTLKWIHWRFLFFLVFQPSCCLWLCYPPCALLATIGIPIAKAGMTTSRTVTRIATSAMWALSTQAFPLMRPLTMEVTDIRSDGDTTAEFCKPQPKKRPDSLCRTLKVMGMLCPWALPQE